MARWCGSTSTANAAWSPAAAWLSSSRSFGEPGIRVPLLRAWADGQPASVDTKIYRSARGAGYPDDLALRVGEQAEGHAGDLGGRLNDPAARSLGRLQRGRYVSDPDKERDQRLAVLERADPARDRPLGPGLDVAVARYSPVRERPPEQRAVERAAGVRVRGPDLEVHDWAGHSV